MQIRVRATAVRSMTLLAILCFILEALVAYRVFALRDLQQAVLEFQLNAQQVERGGNVRRILVVVMSAPSTSTFRLRRSHLERRCVNRLSFDRIHFRKRT